MSLADDIAADVTGVFLNTSDFATSITHYPKGDQSRGATVTAIVDRDLLDSSSSRSSAVGSGDDIRGDMGEAVREQAVIELSTDVTVTCTPTARDTFSINGVLWIAKRVKESDDDMQAVLVQRMAAKTVRRTMTNTG